MEIEKTTRTQHDFHSGDEACFSRKSIGKYSLLREVNRGGMGIVYESFQPELNRKVAIKVLPLTSCHSQTATDRFKREASTAAKLQHNGIAQIFDFGRDENCYYLVMEYVEGETLEEKLQKKNITVPEAIDIVRKVALIISDLHNILIIHRDIKPSNIMIKRNGDAVLLDFGICKSLDDENIGKITHEPVGTPAYMPPEYIRSKGKIFDNRSDIFSLGVMLYEVAAGGLPFEKDDSYYRIVEKILNADFPLPRKKNPAVPRELETIILKCMARNPEERYADAKELVEELERFSRKTPIKARRPVVVAQYLVSHYRSVLRLSGVTLAAVVLALGIYAYFEDGRLAGVSGKITWKEDSVPWSKDFFQNARMFKGLEGEIEVRAKHQFVSFDEQSGKIVWLRNQPGYIIFSGDFQGDVRVYFEAHPLRKDEYFGAFINASDGFSGYILKIQYGAVYLCRDYYENIIKEARVDNSSHITRYVLERVGPEVHVYCNDRRVISFIDYSPIIGEKNRNAGMFFKDGFREILSLKIFEPKQPLAISPLILGQRFFELGQYRNSIREYQMIVKEYPDRNIGRIARFKEGMSYKALGEFDKAMDIFDDIIRRGEDPDILPEAYFQKGICLFLDRREREAESVFLEAVNKFAVSDVKLNSFMFLSDMLASRLQKAASGPDIAYLEGRYIFLIENFELQRPLLTSSTRLFISRLAENRMYDKALGYIGLLEKYFPSQTLTLAWGGIQKGEIYYQMKDLKRSMEAFRDVYDNYKGFSVYEAWALMRMADLSYEQGQYGDAEKTCGSIIAGYKDQKEFVDRAEALLKKIRNLGTEPEKGKK